MQDLLQHIGKLSGNEADLDKLVQKLKSSSRTIKKHTASLDQVLMHILPTEHSLGYAWLLAAYADDVKDHNKYMELCRNLFLLGDGYQLRKCAKKVNKITKQFKASLIITESYITGVLPLQAAIGKLRGPKKNLLTSIHADYLMICLKARCYRQALKVLAVPVFEIDPKTDDMTPMDYLCFQYYAGNVFCAMKKFSRALECYQMALCMPSHVLSAIQIESFKKYVLVCLIVHGEFIHLPTQTISHVVQRNVESLAPSYMELSRNYKKGVPTLQVIVADNLEKFQKDKNYGLVSQVVTSKVRRNIQRLTNTYVVLSLKDIAQQADLDGGPEQAERHVRNMITDGQINARINQRDGMLKFLLGGEDYGCTPMLLKLDSKIKEVMRLSDKLSTINKEILLNPMYIQKTMPREKGTGEEGKGRQFEDGDHMDYQTKMALEASMREQ